jgi:hypothetical protein
MASVNLELSHDSNCLGDKKKVQIEVDKFVKKWSKEIKLFEDELFLEDKKNKVWLLTMPLHQLDLSTSDYATLDKIPNKSRSIFKLFSHITKEVGDCDFGYGEKPFAKEFYKDLMDLYRIENKEGGYSFCATVTLSSESGYYSGAYEFLNNGGIQATFTKYNESDSDSYDEDDD